MTFAQLADQYEKRKVFAPVYKGETEVAGMRSFKSVKSRLKLLIEHFGKRFIKPSRMPTSKNSEFSGFQSSLAKNDATKAKSYRLRPSTAKCS